ncbi:MAG: glycoside hydrolase family 6 protein [Pelagibacteraceae bacterium]|nr:glycoside hydrolase family 6 protein [Pelagibacteraceae bacterium]
MELFYPDFTQHKNLVERYTDLGKIYAQPMPVWLGRSKYKTMKRIPSRINRLLNRAKSKVVSFVIYSIPNRDISGQYSSGGEIDNESYLKFINQVISGIGKHSPIIIYEPDALPDSLRMSKTNANNRIKLMVESLALLCETDSKVYIDCGHPNWLSVNEITMLLKKFKKIPYSGISLNSCNFVDTESCVEYGNAIYKHIKKNFVIDTSRNGLGHTGNIFNPTNVAIGEYPTLNTRIENCDGFLWIKPLGESDGKLNGSPKAGRFSLDYALKIIQNSKKINVF